MDDCRIIANKILLTDDKKALSDLLTSIESDQKTNSKPVNDFLKMLEMIAGISLEKINISLENRLHLVALLSDSTKKDVAEDLASILQAIGVKKKE